MKNANKKSRVTLEATSVERLDTFLTNNVEGMTRRWAKKTCDEGLVFVNNRRQKSGYVLKPGDEIEVTPILPASSARPDIAEADQEFLRSVSIAYEDDDLIVVDKPRCVHSVTLGADDKPTIADFLAYHDKSLTDVSNDKREAGLVQRLDYYTSGLIVAAKSRFVWEALHQLLATSGFEKKYLAVVEGCPSKKEIFVDKRIKDAGTKVTLTDDPEVRRAKTNFELVRKINCPNGEDIALVVASAEGARRHQIRIHSSFAGHPLVGDELYGSNHSIEILQNENLTEGFFLHANQIDFVHPRTKKDLSIVSNNALVKASV